MKHKDNFRGGRESYFEIHVEKEFDRLESRIDGLVDALDKMSRQCLIEEERNKIYRTVVHGTIALICIGFMTLLLKLVGWDLG